MARPRRRKTNIDTADHNKSRRSSNQSKIFPSKPEEQITLLSNAAAEPNNTVSTGAHNDETKKKRRKKSKHGSIGSSKSRLSKITLAQLEGSDIDIRKRPPILRIPLKARVVIWKILPTKALLNLRRVCHRIKVDIDNFVGLPAAIDQTHRSYEFFSRVGIRKAYVLLLEEKKSAPFRLMLKYPDLLEELRIEGTISNGYFAYFMDSCPNLRHINILFSKELLLLEPKFFPISPMNVKQLRHLRRVEIKSETRFNHELQCVQDNLRGLLKVNLKSIPISCFDIQIIHDVYSDVLRSSHQVIAEFVNSKANYLTTIRITIREKRPDSAAASVSEYDAVIGQLLSHPELTASNHLGSVFTLELDEIEFGHHQIMPMRGFLPVSWRKFKKTRFFLLSVNGIHAHVWRILPLKMRNLEYLYLDIIIMDDGNWNLYKTAIHNCSKTLKEITLLEVTVVPHNETTKQAFTVRRKLSTIDVGFIKRCDHLESLTIKCKETESGAICKMKSVTSLPKALEDVHFSHAIISPFQLTRLLVFHRNLISSETEYCSSSSAALRRLLCYLRIAFKFNCTRVPVITIVDYKLRFQNEMASVKRLIASLGTAACYIDMEQTMISIDMSHLVE